MALNIQTPVTGITGLDFENYMAATVEEITLGRNPVTSIAPLPNRVFDVLWKMNLNTALTNIRAPSVMDASEQATLSGIPISTEDIFTYTLTTNGLSKDFTAMRLNSVFQSGDSSTVYKIIYGTSLYYSPTHFYKDPIYTVLSYDGNYISARNTQGNQSVYNTKTGGILSLPPLLYRGTLKSGSKISDDALTLSYNTGLSSNTGVIIETFKLNVGFTGSVLFSSAIGSQGGITGTNDGSVLHDMSSSGNTIVYSNATTLNRYEYTSGTKTWDIKGTTGCSAMSGISSNSDCSRVACYNASNVYIYNWTGSWNLEATIPMLSVSGVKFSRLGNILVINTTTNMYIYNKNPTWVQHSSFLVAMPYPIFHINPTETSIIINNLAGWTNISNSTLYEYDGTSWSLKTTDQHVAYQMSPDWTTCTAVTSSTMYTIDSTPMYPPAGNIVYFFNSRNVGIGNNEKECCADLAKKMATDGSNIIELPIDGSMTVYSSIALKLTSVVSSSILNSLSDTTQSTVLTAFLTSLKGMTGSYNWYGATGSNSQSIQTQVKLGLAQLFDKDPQLNNLIGSASSSSTFLDSSKIATKMQKSDDTFYTKFFSDQQLREVLSAVADKGSRISKLSVKSGGNYVPSNKFNFSVGDTISAMLKVTDIDTTSLNSDRWMITLQHAV
jgi:hypothetical protein